MGSQNMHIVFFVVKCIVTLMDDAPDRELIERAQADPREFAALYQKYALKVYNYFFFRVPEKAKETAEDLTQETFLRAFEDLPRFERRGFSYLTYLLTIAHNILINYYKKHKELSLDAMGGGDEIADESNAEDDRAEARELLWRAIQELPLKEKDLLLLRYHKGLSIREVAHVVKKSENAIKLALARARKSIQHHALLRDLFAFQEQKKKLRPPRFTAKKKKSRSAIDI